MNLLDEPGACSTVTWSEVAQKVIGAGRDWTAARPLLLDSGLRLEVVTGADAEAGAALWNSGSGLSLADRLGLATGDRLDATIWTAGAAWGTSDRVRQLR